MYFVYGCPKVLSLRPEPKPGEQILAVSFNPSGSLLAIASTLRVCLWSGGKDHVPLGVLAASLRGLSGPSLLWKRDSGLLGVVTSAGKLMLVSVKRKVGARPASERFAVPDWFEPQVCLFCSEGGCGGGAARSFQYGKEEEEVLTAFIACVFDVSAGWETGNKKTCKESEGELNHLLLYTHVQARTIHCQRPTAVKTYTRRK